MTDAIRQVQKLFGLNPTGTAAQVAADWCDEQYGQDFPILAAWLRADEIPPTVFTAAGAGNGAGAGDGYGAGAGDGYGYGDGNGYGAGAGAGDGYGAGAGDGYGYGDGYGNGYGAGAGAGDGYGAGDAIKTKKVKGEPTMPQEGDYVCVRSRDQGVVWGTLVWRSGRECRLADARQQYSWRGNATTLFDVVSKGPAATNLRLSEVVGEIDMTEICGVLAVPEKWVEAFKSHPAS